MYDQKVLKSTRCRRDAAILTLLKHLLGSRLISFDWHKWFQTFRSSKYKRKLVPRNFFMWKLPLWSVLSHCSICQHPNLAYQKVGKSEKKKKMWQRWVFRWNKKIQTHYSMYPGMYQPFSVLWIISESPKYFFWRLKVK